MLSDNRQKLALMAAGVGGAAVAGAGISLGRDVYKTTKKNIGFIALVLAIVFCPFIGGRGLVRGHDRSLFGTVFLTVVGSIILIIIGFCAATLALFVLLGMGNMPDPLPYAILGGFVVTAAVGGVGMIVGLIQRPKRLKVIAISRDNDKFLADHGFQETNGADITHYDPSGQALRFLEAHPDRLVFMVVGRRGKRSFIDLDSDGRMVGYSGV